MTTPAQKKLALLAWIAVCLIWGTTYLGIRVSLESMPPALMGGLRWTIAGALLAGFMIARGERLPPPSRWGGIMVMAFLLLGLGNGGVVFAEQWVPSGLAAVLVATSPFWMSGVEACLRDGEKLRANTVAGLLIGFSGILVLVWPDLTLDTGNRQFLAGVIALQIASFGWALGSAYSRRHARNDNILGTTALQMLAGGLMMLAAGTALGEWQRLFFTPRTGAALAYLSTIGAVGGFVAYTYALRHLSVSFVSLYAYINPVIAVALGVLLLNEPFDWRMATAAGLVFAGVAVVRWGKSAGDVGKRRACVSCCCGWCCSPAMASAQTDTSTSAPNNDGQVNRVERTALFLSGAAVGLLAHEMGHLVFGVAFDAEPRLKRVEFHGIPFFALTHRKELSARREAMVSSAGFWVQHATDEWILYETSQSPPRARPFCQGGAHVQRADIGRLCGCRVRQDRTLRT